MDRLGLAKSAAPEGRIKSESELSRQRTVANSGAMCQDCANRWLLAWVGEGSGASAFRLDMEKPSYQSFLRQGSISVMKVERLKQTTHR